MRYKTKVQIGLLGILLVSGMSAGRAAHEPSTRAGTGGAAIQKLIDEITNTDDSFEDTWAALNRLNEHPVDDVLPAVLSSIPEVQKGRVFLWGTGWDITKKEGFDAAPVGFRRDQLLRAAWRRQCARAHGALPLILARLLPDATTTEQRFMILVEFSADRWTSAAEEPIAVILRDDNESAYVRARAASILLQRKGSKYHGIVRDLAITSQDVQLKRKLYRSLMTGIHGIFYTRAQPRDPKLVALGMDIIEKQVAAAGRDSAAYFTASELARYLNEPLPQMSEPKYWDKRGNLNEAWFAEPAIRARAWWEHNKERILNEIKAADAEKK